MFTITHLLVGLSLGSTLAVAPSQTFRVQPQESFLAGAAVNIVQSRNQISGHIFNTSRQPLSDIYVELLDEVNSTIGRTRTDGGGAFHFSGMSGGNFQVRVMVDGSDYEGQTQSV